jgi:hypothetical protein
MPLRERDRELRRRRHRRERIRKLRERLSRAQSQEEREQLVQKMIKRAPWRYQEFLALLHSS